MTKIDELPDYIKRDVDLIGRISAIPTILEVICQSTGMGFAAVAKVTEEKWVACAVKDDIGFGLKPGEELKLETTICHEIRQNHKEVVIDHVAEDPTFSTHHTPLMYGFQSYISVPIISKKGVFFGTLCAIDPRPASLNNPKILGMFHLFADLIAFHQNAMLELRDKENELLEEREIAVLRDQFIAILGHDLRNPLSAVMNVSKILLKISDEKRVTQLAHILQDSSYRMKALIDNILDFAKGKLGGGIVLSKAEYCLESNIEKVVNEVRFACPESEINIQFELHETLFCDAERLEQLLSNLISNAVFHGIKGRPILVKATQNNKEFVLSVVNSSKKIPQDVLSRLFNPFTRGQEHSNSQGLGLGLYISSEIAKAHGGEMEVQSNDAETCFTFRMKL